MPIIECIWCVEHIIYCGWTIHNVYVVLSASTTLLTQNLCGCVHVRVQYVYVCDPSVCTSNDMVTLDHKLKEIQQINKNNNPDTVLYKLSHSVKIHQFISLVCYLPYSTQHFRMYKFL